MKQRVLYSIAIEHRPGCYRVRLANSAKFAQIKRARGGWVIELRASETGELLGYRGIWPTLRDAIGEIRRYLPIEDGGEGLTHV